MSRELERHLRAIVECVIEDEATDGAIRQAGFEPAKEGQRLLGILARGIQDFQRFYVRRGPAENTMLSIKEVAARYRMTEQWAYHCKELRPFAVKVGRTIRFRESDLERFEKARKTTLETRKTGSFPYDVVEIMRHRTKDDKPAQSKIELVPE